MRVSVRVAVGATLLVATLAVTETSASAGCARPRGAWTVKDNKVAEVFKTARKSDLGFPEGATVTEMTYFGCHKSTGRRSTLGRYVYYDPDTGTKSEPGMWNLHLRGVYAAWVDPKDKHAWGSGRLIRTANLQAKRLSEVEDTTAVPELVVSRHGSVAWIAVKPAVRWANFDGPRRTAARPWSGKPNYTNLRLTGLHHDQQVAYDRDGVRKTFVMTLTTQAR